MIDTKEILIDVLKIMDETIYKVVRGDEVDNELLESKLLHLLDELWDEAVGVGYNAALEDNTKIQR